MGYTKWILLLIFMAFFGYMLLEIQPGFNAGQKKAQQTSKSNHSTLSQLSEAESE